MNGYELTKSWFNFVKQNLDVVNNNHTAMYFYIVEMFNSNNWCPVLGLPTDHTMSLLNIRSYKTYKKILDDLISFKVIKLIEKSKNQFTSNKIALVKNTKAITKAIHSQLPKQLPKQDQSDYQSDYQSDSTIIKQLNNKTIKLITENATLVNDNIGKWIASEKTKPSIDPSDIDDIYAKYPSRCVVKDSPTGKSSKDKEKIGKLLKKKTKEELTHTIGRYVEECRNNNIYMKNFSTFLNNLPDYKQEKQSDNGYLKPMASDYAWLVIHNQRLIDKHEKEGYTKEMIQSYIT